MKEFLFPDDIEDKGYRAFPDEYEDCELTVFHGTTWKNFEGIRENGFRPAQELFSVDPNHPTSTSFSYTSPLALGYACNLRSLENSGVIVMVKFEPHQTVRKEQGGCWHLDDHQNSQPKIIGFCRVPDKYIHI